MSLALVYPIRDHSQDRSPENFLDRADPGGLRVDFREPVLLSGLLHGKVIGQSYVPLARICAFRVPRRRF